MFGDIGSLFSAWEPEISLPRAEVERPYFRNKPRTAKKTLLDLCLGAEEGEVEMHFKKVPDVTPRDISTLMSAPTRTWAQERDVGTWRVMRALKAEVVGGRIHNLTATKIYMRMKFMIRYDFETQFLAGERLDEIEAAGGSNAIVRAVAAAVDDTDNWIGKRRAEAETMGEPMY
jgi:hypothetical protein